ncbi:MAG: HAD hydrolase-like protein [Oscillospiraceae bacterium]
MHILFDLDGTLCNTEEGVVKSALYALQKMGWPLPPQKDMVRFIGPPLGESFREICGMPPESVEEATEGFRERYSQEGKFENFLYPGMEELLKTLFLKGEPLYVATSKLLEPALEILERHGVTQYFRRICGSTADGRLYEKTGIVGEILREIPVGEPVIMVGDTYFDVIGAHENHIPCVAVGYGFAPEGSLGEADYFCETMADLSAFLQKGVL